MSTFSKTVSVTSTTSQSLTKVMGSNISKTVTVSSTTSESVTKQKNNAFSKTVSVTSTTSQSVTKSRGYNRNVSVSSVTGASATVVRTKGGIFTTSVHTSDSVVRAPSTFNWRFTDVLVTDDGVTIANNSGVYFAYPANAPKQQVNMPRPQYGNVHSVILQTVQKRSRNGQLYLFKRDPTYEQQILEFARLDESTFQKLITFMKLSAGNKIQYLDHKGKIWQGSILTDPFELVNDMTGPSKAANGITDWYKARIIFEGI